MVPGPAGGWSATDVVPVGSDVVTGEVVNCEAATEVVFKPGGAGQATSLMEADDGPHRAP